ncbi:internal scaffolding protein [Blackfly microvirus SF02]|uniref:Internal scaffolding protein n=1 Tax=Blackfly microvirus SF02 TaxID=2576452 RepID=A0A4P8PKC9_9VIRU|nr:internal scaffolding protein [Blackfly microvirus SF02]
MAKFPQAFHDFAKSNGSDSRTNFEGPSLTRQEFADECDINSLMKRYEGHVTGGPGNMGPLEPMYLDFVNLPQDLMGYLQFMDDAERSFMSLPAIVRKEFDNSAHEFVAYASDPGNLDQMRSWGLAPPAKPLEPVQEKASPASSPEPAAPAKAP